MICLAVDPAEFGTDRDPIRLVLEAEDIEARPVWEFMHMQPVFRGCAVVGSDVTADLFERGLCLPSGYNLTETDLARVVEIVRRVQG